MRLRVLALTGPALIALAPVTALAGWSPPAVVTPRDGAAYAVPQGAAEGRRAIAVWVRAPIGTRGQARVHVATRSDRAARWSAPLTLSAPGVDAPRVALNARGDAAVVWVAGRRLVAAVRRGPEGDWVVSAVVEAGGGVQETRVVVDRGGRPTVLWTERVGSGFVVRVAARPSARTGWTVRPPRVATPGPSPPAIALSRTGAMVAWTDDDGTRAARTVRGAFERSVELSSDAGSPAAAVNATGGALATWSAALPGGTSVVLGAGRASSSTWGVAEDLGIGLRPVAALNDRGDAVVAWSLGQPGAMQGIEAATRRRARGAWRASTVVGRRECTCVLLAGGAAVDGRGAALVTWRRDDDAAPGGGGAADLAPGGVVWRTARVAPGRMTSAPAVSADGSGGGLAVWVEAGRGGGVRAVTLRP